MKTRIIKLMAVLALLFTAIPMQSQNYLKIWFKDGHTERHFMHLVKEITSSKYDLDGNLHSDYQLQQIVMVDTTYSYYIADIDSMSFKKVDEEKIMLDFVNVISSVVTLFDLYSNDGDIANHLDEIRNIDGVEDIQLTESDLIVKVRDWLPVFLHFPEKTMPEDVKLKNDQIMRLMRKSAARNSLESSFTKPVKVALINQQSSDEGRIYVVKGKSGVDVDGNSYSYEGLEGLSRDFSALGIDARYYDREILDPLFFKKDMYNYDFIYLNTHGSYSDEGQGRLNHWLYTGDEITVVAEKTEKEINEKGQYFIDLYKYVNEHTADLTDMAIGATYEVRKGLGAPKDSVIVFYTMISEDYIRKSFHSWPKDHYTVFFNAACESVKGTKETIHREIGGVDKEININPSMANVFLSKNVDVYFGYNENTYTFYDLLAIQFLFDYMLYGSSLEAALHLMSQYESILVEQYVDKYDKKGNLTSKDSRRYLVDFFASDESKETFIVKTSTYNKSEQEFEEEYNKTSQVTLIGYTTMLEQEKSAIKGPSNVKCGFLYKDDTNFDVSKDKVFTTDLKRVESPDGNTMFSLVVKKPEPGQKRYYQAFTYDGIHYNFGDICYFKIPEIPHLSLELNTINLTSGETRTVQITSGSGSYSIEKIEPSGVVTASISGNRITIDAKTAGTAKITVKDDKSGQTAIIEVTVTENSGPISYLVCPDDHHPHMIDLGLPSGTMWACCNVDTDHPENQSPSNYGGYYAWGETETKLKYDFESYIHCDDGTASTCHDLGDDIAGTQYDVAHMKWGGLWEIPSKELQDELISCCISTWTTQNGVEGRLFKGINGASIFLPAAGQKGYGSNNIINAGSVGVYWSSTPSPQATDLFDGYFMSFYNRDDVETVLGYRYAGKSVRPVVRNPAPFLPCPDGNHPHMVDLGLPSGTKWACCNVDTEHPENQSPTNFGGYYAWGETETKNKYNWRTYIHCDGKESTCHDLGSDIAGTQYDVAHVKWGGSWVMPSGEQLDELLNNCTYELIMFKGIKVGKYTSKTNGNRIFLPAAGECYESHNYTAGSSGCYWTSSVEKEKYVRSAIRLYFINSPDWDFSMRCNGLSVRPVVSN